ncbi:MAG: TerB family tellurite resistance protein [Polyangiaceae bacterium]|nr:TerB family tellurite resistance protein [Polyangiaceae bacterium]
MPADSVLRARELLRQNAADLPSAEVLSSSTAAADHDAYHTGLLEAAFLVAAADGQLSKEEVGSLVDVVSQIGEGATPSELAGMVYDFSVSLEKEGRTARAQAIAEHVSDPRARKEIVGFAALVALCDGELAPSELFVLHTMGKAFGLDAGTVGGIVRGVAEKLGVTLAQ